MGDPATLRMMENENLSVFKELLKVSNTTLLRNVIETYCNIGMYKEQNKANNQELEW